MAAIFLNDNNMGNSEYMWQKSTDFSAVFLNFSSTQIDNISKVHYTKYYLVKRCKKLVYYYEKYIWKWLTLHPRFKFQNGLSFIGSVRARYSMSNFIMTTMNDYEKIEKIGEGLLENHLNICP